MLLTIWMNLKTLYVVSERSRTQKDTYYDSIHTRYPEQANPWRQIIDYWLPESEGGG